MRSRLGGYLLLIFVLAIFGAFAWLTRHPDSELLERAETWPFVGPVASWFRDQYPSSPPGDVPEGETLGGEGQGLEPRVVPPPMSPGDLLWILPGEKLKASRSPGAATLFEFKSVTRVAKLGRRGDWYRVRHRGKKGWVLLEGYDERAAVPYGEATQAPKPLPPRPPAAEDLTAARELFGGAERVSSLGPYTLFTDSRDDAQIAYLGGLTSGLDRFYAERYARRPLGTPREAVVLYRGEVAYRVLQRRTERIGGLLASGHNSRGLAALYIGDRRPPAVASTLLHELGHFLNRRALGPQLPPWLDEGLADDLALSRLGVLGTVRRTRTDRFEHVEVEGALASLAKLRGAIEDGSLPTLREVFALEWEAFVKPPRSGLHYGVAGFWVRYLLAGEGGKYRAALQEFLAAIAEGEPPAQEELRRRLGAGWGELERGYRAWLELQAKGAGLDEVELP